MKKRHGVMFTTVLVTAAIARAQPAPRDPVDPGSDAGDATPSQIGSDGQPVPPPDDPPPTGDELTPEQPGDPYADPTVPVLPRKRAIPQGPINLPSVLTTPTGFLLPAAVLYLRTSIDTGGGVTADSRVGLGDVAEFGIATTDEVRERIDRDAPVSRIQPYVTASFRLGVAEERLFPSQPGITLGFRKSFERNHDGYRTRIAELTLVASKHLGKNVVLHVGGAFWDASVFGRIDGEDAARREITLHDGPTSSQLRAFGGIAVRPLPRSQILIDLGWAPEFCYQCTGDANKIKLRPTLSWGVRYQVADSMYLESGVRVPDIGQANLLDAQIFGQVTFTSWALRRAVDSLK